MLLLFTLLLSALCDITVVSRPDTTKSNQNYQGSRDPLKPLHFIKLPVGNVKPSHWVREYLNNMKNGLTGKLSEVSGALDKNTSAWTGKGNQYGGEELPYWLRGYSALAYILEDETMMRETQEWVNGVLSTVQDNGFFGPNNRDNDKPYLWPHMLMLQVLQTHYEHSNDERILTLMTNFFKWENSLADDQFLDNNWENQRGGDNTRSVLWLYNITGDEFLLDLATKIHNNVANWTNRTILPNWHGVNNAQGFREPATHYLRSGEYQHLEASYSAHNLARRVAGDFPGGMFGATDEIRIGRIDPQQPSDICTVVEEMGSDETMLQISGDPYWADQCENVAFNTLPAAFTDDFRAFRYFTAPNLCVSDNQSHSPGLGNGNDNVFVYSNDTANCCKHNHSQGWPYYAQSTVMATNDDGLAVLLLTASVTEANVGNKVKVQLAVETKYPFEESLMATVYTSTAVTFPLYVRIPAWCDEATLKINGKDEAVEITANKYLRIEREWQNGDFIVVGLPMKLSRKIYQTNQNSASVNYGPLTMSIKIKERTETSGNASWPKVLVFPDSEWNFSLIFGKDNLFKDFKVNRTAYPSSENPFTVNGNPLEIVAKARQVPSWKIDKSGLCGVIPLSMEEKSEAVSEITLVPMGAQKIRVSAMPWTSE